MAGEQTTALSTRVQVGPTETGRIFWTEGDRCISCGHPCQSEDGYPFMTRVDGVRSNHATDDVYACLEWTSPLQGETFTPNGTSRAFEPVSRLRACTFHTTKGHSGIEITGIETG